MFDVDDRFDKRHFDCRDKYHDKCHDRCHDNHLDGIKDIKEGICNIKIGLKDLCDALEALRCCRICEARNNLIKGIRKVKEGLCQIEKGLDDILKDRC